MDFYVILGLGRGASVREVKRAYTRLARRYHPDLNPGDREAAALYRRATEAFETLTDPERRQLYDTGGWRPEPVRTGSIEFHGFDFSTPVSGASATFDELFADVRRAAPSSVETQAEKGSDVFAEVELDFAASIRGVERTVTVTRLGRCDGCGGSGVRRAPEAPCAECDGSGETRWRRGHMVFSKTCGVCGGTGRQRRHPCAACGAEGVVPRTEDVTFQVPPGVGDGARMRVGGQGSAGRRGGAPGDLYVHARVTPHPRFVRDGDDIHLEVPVAIHEAVLGASVEVPTVDGPVSVTVPPGTEAGQRLRLPGRGAPSPRTGQRGDQVVTITVALPRVDDERSRELLREFGRLHDTDVRAQLFED